MTAHPLYLHLRYQFGFDAKNRKKHVECTEDYGIVWQLIQLLSILYMFFCDILKQLLDVYFKNGDLLLCWQDFKTDKFGQSLTFVKQ